MTTNDDARNETDPATATARGYAFSFAIAAGVTAFGALVGFLGMHRKAAEVREVRENTAQRAA